MSNAEEDTTLGEVVETHGDGTATVKLNDEGLRLFVDLDEDYVEQYEREGQGCIRGSFTAATERV